VILDALSGKPDYGWFGWDVPAANSDDHLVEADPLPRPWRGSQSMARASSLSTPSRSLSSSTMVLISSSEVADCRICMLRREADALALE
jgi:hypothetical protein